jgi:hypothetical protein
MCVVETGGRSSPESGGGTRSDSPKVPDSPASAGRGLPPDSPVRGSPLRPSLTLFGSGSGSASGSASGAAAHRRTDSTASGSDEIMGRLEFDDRPGSAGGRSAGRGNGAGGGYARPYR